MATQPTGRVKRTARTMFKATPAALALAVAGSVATGSVALAAFQDTNTGEVVACLSVAGTLRILEDGRGICFTTERRLSIDSFGGPAGGDLTGSYPNPQLRMDSVGQAELASGAVGSSEIANSAVKSSHLLDLSVTGYDIAPKAIDRSKLDILAVGHDQLGISAVHNDNLATDAVSGGKVVDRSIKKADLADGAVGARQLGSVSTIVVAEPFGAGQGGISVVATCAPGEKVLSGGYEVYETDIDDAPSVEASRPYASSGSGAHDSWLVRVDLSPIQQEFYGGDSGVVTAYVICLAI